MEGVAKLKAVEIAVMDLAIALAVVAKDGVDFSDLGALMVNEKVKAAVVVLVASIKDVPAELADLDLAEGLDCAMILMKKLPELLAALKK